MNIVLLERSEVEHGRILSGNRVRHIRSVLKLSVGDVFRAGIVDSSLGCARILSITDSGITFEYTPTDSPEPLLPITLIIGAVRPLVMKRILRDVAAFGCANIYVFNAENGEKSYTESSLWREDGQITRALTEGLAISKQVLLPQVKRLTSLRAAIEQDASSVKLFADSGAVPMRARNSHSTSISVVIGAERGFTAGEIEHLRHALYEPISLGKRVLRSETAAITALAVCATRAGLL